METQLLSNIVTDICITSVFISAIICATICFIRWLENIYWNEND